MADWGGVFHSFEFKLKTRQVSDTIPPGVTLALSAKMATFEEFEVCIFII